MANKTQTATKQNESKAAELELITAATKDISSTSGKIRALYNMKRPVAQVYKDLQALQVTTKDGGEIRYQHVRNVLVQEVGKAQLNKFETE